jgi:hypothetical protein
MGTLFRIKLGPLFTQILPEIVVYGNQFISATIRTGIQTAEVSI